MAHELLRDDKGNAAMFYVEAQPWHRLGTQLDHPPSAEEAIRAAGLNWEVAKAPLFYHRTLGETGVFPGQYVLVPGEGWTDKERPIFGQVSEAYKVLQNRDAFRFFDLLIENGYATYETAGALGKGERIWVLVRLQGDYEVGEGDTIQRYLLLANTHDGKSSVQIRFTPIRVVCRNTLTMALTAMGNDFNARHDATMQKNLGALADFMMTRIEDRYRDIQRDFMRMKNRPLIGNEVAHYFARVFPDPVLRCQDPVSKSVRKSVLQSAFLNRKACVRLFHEADTCRLANDTLWSAYNAVTEYVDHWQGASSRSRSQGGRLARIWFGSGYRDKVRAYTEALRLCRS